LDADGLEYCDQEAAQKNPQPSEDAAEIVADG
jgi:hypothetical protein